MKTPDVRVDMPHELPGKRLFAAIDPRAWVADLNWYQVAVVAVATFAIAMDLVFPPIRIALAGSFAVYAGHAYMPFPAAGAVRVDYIRLALELLAIIVAAIASWCMGAVAGRRRNSTPGPA